MHLSAKIGSARARHSYSQRGGRLQLHWGLCASKKGRRSQEEPFKSRKSAFRMKLTPLQGWHTSPTSKPGKLEAAILEGFSLARGEVLLSAHLCAALSHSVSSSITRNFSADEQCFQKDGCAERLDKHRSPTGKLRAVPGAHIKVAHNLYSALTPTGSQKMTNSRKVNPL